MHSWPARIFSSAAHPQACCAARGANAQDVQSRPADDGAADTALLRNADIHHTITHTDHSEHTTTHAAKPLLFMHRCPQSTMRCEQTPK